MKNLILTLFVLIPLFTYSQRSRWDEKRFDNKFFFASVSFDPGAAFMESRRLPNGLDASVGVGVKDRGAVVSLFYERFQALKYQNYGSRVAFTWDPIQNFKHQVGGEVSIINRFGPTFVSYAAVTELQYHPPRLDRFFVFFGGDLQRATDVSQDWRVNTEFGIGFKF